MADPTKSVAWVVARGGDCSPTPEEYRDPLRRLVDGAHELDGASGEPLLGRFPCCIQCRGWCWSLTTEGMLGFSLAVWYEPGACGQGDGDARFLPRSTASPADFVRAATEADHG